MLAYVILEEMLVRCNYCGNQETGFLLCLSLFYYVGESGGILKTFHSVIFTGGWKLHSSHLFFET